ncbi:AbrB/MazE/SpoVT family DNA-binding domain-containing protein [Luteolibacter luteus]|uniref:AbrB/MazE/SpoVT family DNA-binding domain-containing protein n=1 Tax=Luteolibacter luteus TaxID=2728835 RepID=A0A858RKG5_9BACT|nr:AbrB/MazE/SpoVT family DNA-binding domain-containing protein [Luteolibacter luteus]QJE97796.1 AbrB/MazE/SpoVT family DNA-binding domain-containing protein [Luteolibacter luteus]
MSIELKIIRIGDELGITLPSPVMEKLGVTAENHLVLTPTEQGFVLKAAEDEFSRQMRLAEEIMREDRDVLHLLAQ